MKWESNFSEDMLKKGYEIYMDERIESLYINGDYIEASVYDDELYELEIQLDHQHIQSFYCTCEESKKHHYCEHMAAVLYAYQQEEKEKDIQKTFKENKGNNHLYEQVHEIVKDVTYYKNKLNRIVDIYLEKENYISYYQESDILFIFQQFLHDDIQLMIHHTMYLQAFECMNHILFKLEEINVSLDDCELNSLIHGMYEKWLLIIGMVDDKSKEMIFKWFYMHLFKFHMPFINHMIQDILHLKFKENEYGSMMQKIA